MIPSGSNFFMLFKLFKLFIGGASRENDERAEVLQQRGPSKPSGRDVTWLSRLYACLGFEETSESAPMMKAPYPAAEKMEVTWPVRNVSNRTLAEAARVRHPRARKERFLAALFGMTQDVGGTIRGGSPRDLYLRPVDFISNGG
jgi:hypothetical protein